MENKSAEYFEYIETLNYSSSIDLGSYLRKHIINVSLKDIENFTEEQEKTYQQIISDVFDPESGLKREMDGILESLNRLSMGGDTRQMPVKSVEKVKVKPSSMLSRMTPKITSMVTPLVEEGQAVLVGSSGGASPAGRGCDTIPRTMCVTEVGGPRTDDARKAAERERNGFTSLQPGETYYLYEFTTTRGLKIESVLFKDLIQKIERHMDRGTSQSDVEIDYVLKRIILLIIALCSHGWIDEIVLNRLFTARIDDACIPPRPPPGSPPLPPPRWRHCRLLKRMERCDTGWDRHIGNKYIYINME